MQPLRFGIVSFAHHHAYSYAAAIVRSSDAVLVAVADEDRERGEEAASRYDCAYHQETETLLGRDDIDAVVVTVSNRERYETVLAAARSGKHIFCEKPFSLDIADGREMIAACEQHGVALQVAFPMRFFPSAMSMREAVRGGAVGTPLAVSATNQGYKPDGWFSDPELGMYGAVMDHTVHVADMLRWVLGAEIRSVYAEVDTRLNPGFAMDDCGMLSIEMENGVFASLDPSWSRPKSRAIWGGLTFSVVGETGVISMDAFNENIQWTDDTAMRYSLVPWAWAGNYGNGLIAAFIKSLGTGTPPPITGRDGLRATEAALAAYESARTGRIVPIREISAAS